MLETPPSLWQTCSASGGSNGLDARGTNARSTKDCRLWADSPKVIRRPTDVRPNASGDRTIEVRTNARLRQTVKGCPTTALRAIVARAQTEGLRSDEVAACQRELARREGN